MEKYNIENLVLSLFYLGFERVDSTLITLVLGYINTNKKDNSKLEFENKDFSKNFQKIVDCRNSSLKFKEGLSLSSNIGFIKNQNWTIRKFIVANHSNKILISYLENIDFKEIILRKIQLIGLDKIDKLDNLFCDKEKQIIYNMFKIDKMHEKEKKMRDHYYQYLFDQEKKDTDNAIATLRKFKKENK